MNFKLQIKQKKGQHGGIFSILCPTLRIKHSLMPWTRYSRTAQKTATHVSVQALEGCFHYISKRLKVKYIKTGSITSTRRPFQLHTKEIQDSALEDKFFALGITRPRTRGATTYQGTTRTISTRSYDF